MDEDEEELNLEELLQKHEADYLFFSEKLIATVKQREDFVKLLKIAHPDKIADIKAAISAADTLIQTIEEQLEMLTNIIKTNKELSKKLEDLAEFVERVDVALIKHFKENCPEKLEMLEAILSDDGKSH